MLKDSNTKKTTFNSYPTEDDLLNILHTGYDESDPRSIYYKRIHVKPEINWHRSILNITFTLFISILITIITYLFLALTIPEYGFQIACVVFILIILLFILIRFGEILIWSIRVYQHFAPIQTRNKCRFEPSCSVYMIQAIEKLGVIKGVLQGIKRLRKCNISNGGYDYLE